MNLWITTQTFNMNKSLSLTCQHWQIDGGWYTKPGAENGIFKKNWANIIGDGLAPTVTSSAAVMFVLTVRDKFIRVSYFLTGISSDWYWPLEHHMQFVLLPPDGVKGRPQLCTNTPCRIQTRIQSRPHVRNIVTLATQDSRRPCYVYVSWRLDRRRFTRCLTIKPGYRMIACPAIRPWSQASHQPSEWCIRFAQMCRCVFTNTQRHICANRIHHSLGPCEACGHDRSSAGLLGEHETVTQHQPVAVLPKSDDYVECHWRCAMKLWNSLTPDLSRGR